MTPEDFKRAEELLADPDYEDCERFASWYGRELLDIARSHAELLADVQRAHALMDNQEGASDPWDSVCGQLPAGGIRCEELADQVLDILTKALAKATTPTSGEAQ